MKCFVRSINFSIFFFEGGLIDKTIYMCRHCASAEPFPSYCVMCDG